MASYFLITSALVKRHVAEPGHTWVRTLCTPRLGNSIIVAEIALVEVLATFSRMARESVPRLTIGRRNRVIRDFESLFLRQYVVIEVNRPVLSRASDLCRIHPLRAYDAVQLACALTRRDDDLAAGRSAPVFVCADTVLLRVATAEGLAVANPNAYP